MIGRRLGHYEIVEKLGEGGMGAVYRARDTTLGREVALKLLPELVSGDSEKVARLEREAHLLAALNHSNIATLHGLEESNGLKYLVMELVAGETLADRIARGSLPIEECFGIFRQIAEGLEAAHEKGVIHRDLKPANVIVTSEERVKILDFGLAKAGVEMPSSDVSKSPTLTREGTEHGVILGTASYMSPEQARGKPLDRRTDIWSFGCVLYEALSGKKAFDGETVSDILAAILEKEPDWTALPASTPAKIRELLRWCLQKDPRRRMRDIGDARLESDESAATTATVRRHSSLPWAMAAVLFGSMLWSLLRPERETELLISRLTVALPQGRALNDSNDPAVAVSPDGKHLVYVAGMLYVRPIDELEARPLPGTERAATAFFSPDGEWVGFLGEGLKKVRLDGGPPIHLGDLPDPWGGSWGVDDTILLAPDVRSGLSRVSATGGPLSVASTLDKAQGEISHRWPEILPDGRSALFTILTVEGGQRIGLLSLETGKHRVLLDKASFARYVPTGHLAYVSQGVLYAAAFDLERLSFTDEPSPLVEGVWTDPAAGTAHFAISQNGTLAFVPQPLASRRLVWVDGEGVVQPVTNERRGFTSPRLSPDGQKLSISIDDGGSSHIWVYEIARDTFVRLTFGSEEHARALWTPDGNRLVFQRGIPFNLFWQAADGGGDAERLTTSPYHQFPSSLSPDGEALLYMEWTRGSDTQDLWLLSLEGEREGRPLLQAPFREPHGAVSPDGRYLAYASDESGRFEIYVRSFPDLRGKWQVSNEGGRQPVWARTGREIFYRSGRKMMVVAVEEEAEFRAGKPSVLFEGDFFNPGAAFPQYDVTADGKNFVMIEDFGSQPTQIHIVQNWFEELKQRVPRDK